MNWQKSLKKRLKVNEPLKDKTTFRIGGQAQFFAEPRDTDELCSLVRFAKDNKIRVFIIGAGSNILVDDAGLKGMVLRLSAPAFRSCTFEGSLARPKSGMLLAQLIRKAQAHSLSGPENFIGIPGTVGGALVMNAGAWGKSIGDLVEDVQVMDYNGLIKTFKKKEIKFSYRASNLAKYIVLGATLRLERADRDKVSATMKKFLAKRRQSQDNTLPNAGCIFKNPHNDSAGRLIDLCGLKGRCIGEAKISEKHANFMLNTGNARTVDVLKLMCLARRCVKNKFKVDLKPEIKVWH